MIALASVSRFHLHAKDAPLRRVDDKSEGVRKRAGLLDRWGGEAIDGRHSVEDMVVSHIYATGFGFGTTRPGGGRVRLLGSVRRDT